MKVINIDRTWKTDIKMALWLENQMDGFLAFDYWQADDESRKGSFLQWLNYINLDDVEAIITELSGWINDNVTDKIEKKTDIGYMLHLERVLSQYINDDIIPEALKDVIL